MTAVRTISMRLMNTAGELQELGEDADGAAESVTKLQTELLNLTGGRVDIMQDSDTFKNTTQILRELSEVWEDLSQVQQASITRLVAGQRQGNVFSALMTGMSDGISATETSLNSFGSALSENEKWMQSIEGHTSKLNASFQELSNTIIDSDAIKLFVSAGDGLVQSLNKADGAIVKLAALPVTLAAITSAGKMFDASNFGKNFKGFFQDIGGLKIQSSVRILPHVS